MYDNYNGLLIYHRVILSQCDEITENCQKCGVMLLSRHCFIYYSFYKIMVGYYYYYIGIGYIRLNWIYV